MYGYVYKTKNLINGKIYVGKHRCSEFTENYKGSGKVLWNAINKYGWDNFKVELLEECQSSEELNEREKYWIKYYKSQDRNIGYNIAPGGNGGNLIEGYDEITKSAINKKKAVPYENNIFHKIPRIGKLNHNYGKSLSDEVKDKISKTKTGVPLSDECKLAKSIAAKNAGIRPPSCEGTTWYNNGTYEIPLQPSQVDEYLSKGYKKGRLGWSDSTREKMKNRKHATEYHRVCALCNSEFIAKGPTTKYCNNCKGVKI